MAVERIKNNYGRNLRPFHFSIVFEVLVCPPALPKGQQKVLSVTWAAAEMFGLTAKTRGCLATVITESGAKCSFREQ